MDKGRYIAYNNCNGKFQLPIFSKPWWLDAVCGEDSWDAIVLDDDRGGVKCLMPVVYMDKEHKIVGMPTLTQKLGIYIIYPEGQSLPKRLSYENEIVNEVLNLLPSFDKFNVNFNYNFTNWLPFYWAGFNQTTRYTYIIDLSKHENLFSCFAPAKRTDIRKATKIIDIKYGLSGEEFIDYYEKSLSKQGKKLSYEKELFLRLYKASVNHSSGEIIYGVFKDQPEIIAGAIFYVWDHESIYSMVTAFDPEFRNTGTSSLLFYSIMEKFKSTGLKFDFEGSMIKPIEHSYNKFGTSQIQYFNISKINSKKARLKSAIKEIISLIK